MKMLLAFLLWCLLFVACWPLAILALFLFPILWLLTLPFRILAWVVEGALGVVKGILFLPARILGCRPGAG